MFTRIAAYLRNLGRRRGIQADTPDEVAFHIEMATQTGVDAGLSPNEARRRALAEFGGIDSAHEGVHDARATWVDAIWQDVRFSVATLKRSKSFAATAVLVLALGIGANAAIFSVVVATFLTPLGVDRPDDVLYMYRVLPNGTRTNLSYEQLEFFRRMRENFTGLAGHLKADAILEAPEGRATRVELVTSNYFDVIGMKPLLGRALGAAEGELATTERAMVLSHDLWTRRFQADPNVVGTVVRLEDLPFTVVGVMPEAFRGLSEPWAPSECWVTPQQFYGERFRFFLPSVIGRLMPRVTLAQAQAAMAVQNAQWSQQQRQGPARRAGPFELIVLSPATDVRAPYAPDSEIVPERLVLSVSLVVVLVLVIAAANISGMLSARALARTREIAVRRALGAGVGRLVRQLTLEGLILSIGGAAVGLVLAQWLISLYRAYTPDRFAVPVRLSAAVVLFTLTLSLFVGICVGLAPALQALRVNVAASLSGTSGPTVRARRWLRHAIVVPQIALALLLMVVAAVHVRALAPLELAHPGYAVEDVTLIRTWLRLPEGSLRPDASGAIKTGDLFDRLHERERHLAQELTTRIEGMPGRPLVAFSDRSPLSESEGNNGILLDVVTRGTPVSGRPRDVASMVHVSAHYFDTVAIPLIAGRDFEARDAPQAARVAIVNRALASKLWPGGTVLGQEMAFARSRSDRSAVWLTVVGVAGDTAGVLQPGTAKPIVYLPMTQDDEMTLSYVIARAPAGNDAFIANLRSDIAVAEALATTRVQTVAQTIDEMLFPRRAAVRVLTISGLIGLSLAAVGLYGVVAQSVAQRAREISIRMAVGASRRDVTALILREGALVGALGAVVGLPLGLFAVRLTAHLIRGLPTVAVIVPVVVTVAVFLIVLAACYLPARRAARSDPAAVLRGL